MSINRMIDEFMYYCQSKQLRSKTMLSYEQSLKLLARWLNEQLNIDDVKLVKEQTMRKYIVDLQQRGKYTFYANDSAKLSNCPERRRDFRSKISNTTINNYIRNIKVFFSWLEEQHVVNKSPMLKIKRLPSNRKPKDFITDDEFSRLISKLDKSYFSEYRDYIIINLLMDTGMRLGECLELRIDNINLNSKTIFLSGDFTKSRKDRTVFFSRKMAAELKKWLQYKDRYSETTCVFPSRQSIDTISVASVETNFKNYIRRAGLKEKLSPHALRNNFAKRCLMSGMDIYTLSRILGHSSVTVTEKAYLDLTDMDIGTNYQRFSPLENMM